MKKNATKWKKYALLVLVCTFGASLIINLFTISWLGLFLWACAIIHFTLFIKSATAEATEAVEKYNEAYKNALEQLGGLAREDDNTKTQ